MCCDLPAILTGGSAIMVRRNGRGEILNAIIGTTRNIRVKEDPRAPARVDQTWKHSATRTSETPAISAEPNG